MMLLALAACQPREQVPEATEQIVVITATQAETRTVVGENSMGGGILSYGKQVIKSGFALHFRRLALQE